MQRSERSGRPRALQACEVCRIRKNRCSEDRPCTYCIDHDLECTYSRVRRPKRRRPHDMPFAQFGQRATSINSPCVTRGPIPGTIDFWPNNVNQTASLGERSVHPSRTIAVGHTQRQDMASAPSAMDENSYTTSITTPRNTTSDVMDTNLHTRNLEFYGSASAVAFLRQVETLSNFQTPGSLDEPPERSLASLLHNSSFQPDTSRSMPVASQGTDLNPDRFHFRVAGRFLDAYFSNIHHIQPLFEEELFLARCEDLWFNRPGKQPLSFIALYYATMSLGSLVMTFETPEISGAHQFTWSRKLFNDALAIMSRLGTATDVEIIQCYYMMSKICQHELNPHVAYLYSGQAARTSLAIGINRSPVGRDVAEPRASTAAAKTWWAVYCLDVQTSFALGRPDSLGPDQYHTQHLPMATSGDSFSSPHVLQIVPCMVALSRIMRKVALDLYAQPCEMEQKIHRANKLDAELAQWLEELPLHLRAEHQKDSDACLKSRRLASYIKKQSVVLRLRYLNLRMVIHAIFMMDATTARSEEPTLLRKCQCRCIQSAEDAIDLMYTTFRTDDYFQTWYASSTIEHSNDGILGSRNIQPNLAETLFRWYNSTYALYAVSILLAVIFRQLGRTQPALAKLFAHIDRAIIVLQAMDDCLVVRNAIAIIKRTLVRAKKVPQPALIAQQFSLSKDTNPHLLLHSPVNAEHRTEADNAETLLQSNLVHNDDLSETVDSLDWLNTYPFDDSQQALFWTEWAHEINTLGT